MSAPRSPVLGGVPVGRAIVVSSRLGEPGFRDAEVSA